MSSAWLIALKTQSRVTGSKGTEIPTSGEMPRTEVRSSPCTRTVPFGHARTGAGRYEETSHLAELAGKVRTLTICYSPVCLSVCCFASVRCGRPWCDLWRWVLLAHPSPSGDPVTSRRRYGIGTISLLCYTESR